MKVCIIPARGGSKRIPRKNIRSFAGRPILHYALDAAVEASIFDKIVVSTDDEEIARCAAISSKIDVLTRPSKLADDHATTTQVIAHAIYALGLARAVYTPGSTVSSSHQVCCLYPCTPMVEPQDLQEGLKRLLERGKSYVFPVTEIAPAMQHALRVGEGGIVIPVWPQFNDVRSQDLEPRYRDAAQWYWGWVDAWERSIPIFGPMSLAIKVPSGKAIDINTLEDWQLAEALHGYRWMRRYVKTSLEQF